MPAPPPLPPRYHPYGYLLKAFHPSFVRPTPPFNPPRLPHPSPAHAHIHHIAHRFVQRPNCVDLEAGEAALKASGRYSELVALYQVGRWYCFWVLLVIWLYCCTVERTLP